MSIKGTIQAVNANKYGYYSIKVQGEWYNLNTKTRPDFKEGDGVEFDYYKKDGKYLTVKGDVASAAVEKEPASDKPAGSKPAYQGYSRPQGGQRDTYWADKAVTDAEREPRIAYQGAYERAIEVFRIVDAKGGYPSLEKTKPVDRLEAVRAFIEAEADNIMRLAYAATAPAKADTADKKADKADKSAPAANDESWGE